MIKMGRPYSDEEIFKHLHPLVGEWFRRRFKTFTPPQRYAIVEALKGNNVLVTSPTGSGKTLAGFLPVISTLVSLAEKGKLEDRVYAIYVSPLRALNNDIRRNLEEPLRGIYEIAREKGIELQEIRIAVRTGDTTQIERQRQLKKPPHILITTPETLAIVLSSPKFSRYLEDVRFLIVDEIHAMAESKRGTHLTLSIERLQRKQRGKMVRIGLSATIHPLEEVAKFLVGFEDGRERDCVVADVTFFKPMEIRVLSPIDDFFSHTPEEVTERLYDLLAELVKSSRTSLIFTNTRSATERVVYHLKKRLPDQPIKAHHSSLSREVRLEVEEDLKAGRLKAVVCVHPLSLVITEDGPVRISKLNSGKILALGSRLGYVGFERKYSVKCCVGYRIRTRMGYEIVCTPEHRFLRNDGEWVRADEIREGDMIAVIGRIPSKSEYSIPPELARAAGYFVSRGCLGRGYVRLFFEDARLLRRYKEVLERFFGGCRVYRIGRIYALDSRNAYEFFRRFSKEFPGNVFRADLRAKEEFFKGISDGGLRVKGRFSDGIKYVLLQLGLLSEVRDGKISIIGSVEEDYFFDEVLEVKRVKLRRAYGILNSETGNFVVNGFITKNSSTSLELGIDIGYIDLVILLGSPKSINRALQRIGRSGHRLEEVSRGVIVVVDQDDLVECTVLSKEAVERRLDRVHIPKKPLDVLCQHVVGMALEGKWRVEDALRVIRSAYPYKDLKLEEFVEVLRYLSGRYSELEKEKVYGKIWFDEERMEFGRRSRLLRPIYYLNVGTIPDEVAINVITKDGRFIGKVEEEFAERLVKGDVFVLAGRTFRFIGSRGMSIIVEEVEGERPTVPSWFSEQLPLSYDLALRIQRFRRIMDEMLSKEVETDKIVEFLKREYLIEDSVARAIVSYFLEQKLFSEIPTDKRLLVEVFRDGDEFCHVFHTLIGRRANEAISRVFAYRIGRDKGVNVKIALTDNGFMLKIPERLGEDEIRDLFKEEEFLEDLRRSLDKTEILRRRFRHVAVRSFMILRNYLGKEKSVWRQQMSADSLLKLIKKRFPEFPVLKETYREIMEDYMDVENALDFLRRVRGMELKVVELPSPSPFSLNIYLAGEEDVVLMEDKRRVLKILHDMIVRRISESR